MMALILRNGLFTIGFFLLLNPIWAQTEAPKLKIVPLTGDFYIYTTYNQYEGNKVPANGMYLVADSGVVLFDTPWDSTQFQPLLDSIEHKHHLPVIICIATHWHSDRTEGLEYYNKKAVRTYTTALTDELSAKNGKKRAAFLIQKDSLFNVGQYSFETFYPGEAHTADNIVIWFDKQKILYGGCLIKGADTENLGYLGDGNKKAYYATLLKLKARFPDPKYIIVSHSDWHILKSLSHSIKLAKKLR